MNNMVLLKEYDKRVQKLRKELHIASHEFELEASKLYNRIIKNTDKLEERIKKATRSTDVKVEVTSQAIYISVNKKSLHFPAEIFSYFLRTIMNNTAMDRYENADKYEKLAAQVFIKFIEDMDTIF